MRALAALSIFVVAGVASGQALFSTGKKESSILFSPEGGNYQLQFSSLNSTYRLVYQTPRSSRRHQLSYGFELGAKTTGSTADIWNSDGVGTSTFGALAIRYSGVYFYKVGVGGQKAYDELALLIGFNRENNTLFDASSQTFERDQFSGTKVALNYWAQPLGQKFFFGGRIGLAKETNSSEIKGRTILTTEEVGGQPLQITKTAFLANEYKEEDINPIRLDVMYQFQIKMGDVSQTFALDLFGTKNSISTSEWEPGVALLIMKPEQPLVSLGGIVFAERAGKTTASLFIGYSF